MDVNEFIQLGIVGVGLSSLIEVIKVRFGTGSLTTKFITVALAGGLGYGFYALQGTPLLASIVAVLGFATVFYAFLLK